MGGKGKLDPKIKKLLQNKDSTIKPEVPSNLMSSMGDTSTSRSVNKRKKDKKGSPELISMAAVQNNMQLHKIRVFSSIATGITAGILDLKGMYGFALFIIVFIITAVLMLIKMGMSLNKYFRPSTQFITTSLWDATMSFVLFWTFLANVLY